VDKKPPHPPHPNPPHPNPPHPNPPHPNPPHPKNAAYELISEFLFALGIDSK